MSLEKDLEILGLGYGFTAEQLRTAYRNFVMSCHPDRNGKTEEEKHVLSIKFSEGAQAKKNLSEYLKDKNYYNNHKFKNGSYYNGFKKNDMKSFMVIFSYYMRICEIGNRYKNKDADISLFIKNIMNDFINCDSFQELIKLYNEKLRELESLIKSYYNRLFTSLINKYNSLDCFGIIKKRIESLLGSIVIDINSIKIPNLLENELNKVDIIIKRTIDVYYTYLNKWSMYKKLITLFQYDESQRDELINHIDYSFNECLNKLDFDSIDFIFCSLNKTIEELIRIVIRFKYISIIEKGDSTDQEVLDLYRIYMDLLNILKLFSNGKIPFYKLELFDKISFTYLDGDREVVKNLYASVDKDMVDDIYFSSGKLIPLGLLSRDSKMTITGYSYHGYYYSGISSRTVQEKIFRKKYRELGLVLKGCSFIGDRFSDGKVVLYQLDSVSMLVYDSNSDEVDFVEYGLRPIKIAKEELSEDDIITMKYVNKYRDINEVLLSLKRQIENRRIREEKIRKNMKRSRTYF